MTSIIIHVLTLLNTRTVCRFRDSRSTTVRYSMSECICVLMTWKGGLTLPVAVFVNITHDTLRVQQKPPHGSLYVFYYVFSTVKKTQTWAGHIPFQEAAYSHEYELQLVILAGPTVSLSRLLAVMHTRLPHVPRPQQLSKVIMCMIKG